MQNPSPSSVKEVRLSEVRERVARNLGLIIARAWLKEKSVSPTAPQHPKQPGPQ